MKRTSRALTVVALSLLILRVPANAQEQTLFGKKFAPYSQVRRDQAWADLSRLRTERARKLFGINNGMLASELESQILPSFSLSPPNTDAIEAIDEWLTIYPKIPSGSQRWLARYALYCARGMKEGYRFRSPKASENSDKIIACVLAAAAANNWFPDPALTDEFRMLLRDPKLKDQASAVLAQKPSEVDAHFDSVLSTSERLIESASALARTEKREVDWRHHQLSWWPKFLASITASDGRMKEEGATTVKEITIAMFPDEEAAQLADSLKSLTALYAKLPDSSKEIFAGRVLSVTGKLQYSNLHPASETLLWEVFGTLDPTWLESNEIESKLSSNCPFYSQSYDLAKAVKIELKTMEIEDLHYGGIPSNDNLRWVVGDLYDEMGDYKESKKQYEIAREIDERLVRTSILKANDFMDRDYNMRAGTYVSPDTADHSLK